MSVHLENFARYVPRLITQPLRADSVSPSQPLEETGLAAVLFADISGFTALTERLGQRGAPGIEEISRLLNEYFGQFTEIVARYGGDIVKFAGDALLTVWRVDDASRLQEAVLCAAHCGLAAQALLHDYAPAPDIRLAMCMGVGAGEISIRHLGGVFGRWEFVVLGDPIRQASHARQQALQGQVMLSPQAQNLLATACIVAPSAETSSPLLATEQAEDHFPRLISSEALPPLEPVSAAPISLFSGAESVLKAYIPGAVLARVAAGHLDYLSELRRVTVLFISLPDFHHGVTLAHAQEVMLGLQTAIYRSEGSINKLTIDDKGVMLIAAFGLPPLAHEDDATRGALAALDCSERLQALGLPYGIGVTTGRAFCGTIGSDTRREYTLIGAVVNLSARLAQRAAETPESPILCSAKNFHDAQNRVRFEALPPVRVKGHQEPVPVYRPLESQEKAHRAHEEVIGREAERQTLATALEALSHSGRSQVVVIEGEAGIGKSHLIENARRQALAKRLSCLSGAGDAIETAAAYHGWRTIFAEILPMDATRHPDERRQRILEHLGQEWRDHAPLLNAFLPLEFPETETTRYLVGVARAETTRRLLTHVLQQHAAAQPTVIFLEDAHWLDSASWHLLLDARRTVAPLLIVLGTRPPMERAIPEYEQLCAQPETHRLKLQALSDRETTELICSRLGVAALPQDVLALIRERAEGNPFFTEEVAYALRDSGLIEIANGECRIVGGVNLAQSDFPDTLQAVITSRIDRLLPRPQLALKVASVIGSLFAFRILREVYPHEEDKPHLPEALAILEQFDLTHRESPEPDVTYLFKHIITREVAYNLMLFAQRRKLHRAIAEWYERAFARDLSPYYSLLAYHWGKAEERAKTVAYLEKASMHAQYLGLPKEAVQFGLEAARWLGVELPTLPAEIGAAIGAEMTSVHTHMAHRQPSELMELPALAAPHIAEAIGHLLRIQPAAFVSRQPELFALMAIKNLHLTLEWGTCAFSPGVYSMYAIVHRALTGDTRTAYEFSKLARELDERQGYALAASLIFVHVWFITPWVFPLRAFLNLAEQGYWRGEESGDLLYSCFNLGAHSVLSETAGLPLDEVERLAAHNADRIANRVTIAAFHCVHERQFARALMGKTHDRCGFSDEEIDEERDIASICRTENYNQIGYYLLSKMRLHYYYGEYDRAREFGDQALAIVAASQGQVGESELIFFHALTLLACSAEAPPEERTRLLTTAEAHSEQIRVWSEDCEANFLHKWLLVNAERDWLAGRFSEAIAEYEAAAQSALSHGYIQHVALAHERAALCFRAQRNTAQTTKHAAMAHAAYCTWGATAKAAMLDVSNASSACATPDTEPTA